MADIIKCENKECPLKKKCDYFMDLSILGVDSA